MLTSTTLNPQQFLAPYGPIKKIKDPKIRQVAQALYQSNQALKQKDYWAAKRLADQAFTSCKPHPAFLEQQAEILETRLLDILENGQEIGAIADNTIRDAIQLRTQADEKRREYGPYEAAAVRHDKDRCFLERKNKIGEARDQENRRRENLSEEPILFCPDWSDISLKWFALLT